jgi:hypothetical protein
MIRGTRGRFLPRQGSAYGDAERDRTPTYPSGRRDRTCNAAAKAHVGSNPTVGSFDHAVAACHHVGIPRRYAATVMANPAKIHPYCANGCGRRIRAQRVAFCSQRCQVEHYRARIIELWRAGELPARMYFNRIVRQHIIEAAGEKCQQCGWGKRNPYTGRVPLEIEHIDGDWTNNRPDNIGILCPNCHALTATFRGANRGRGRPGRPGTASRPLPVQRITRFARPADPPLFSAFPKKRACWNFPRTLAIMGRRERSDRSQTVVAPERRACARL